MGEIRNFREPDVSEVAALFLKIFRKRSGGAGQDLVQYFQDILLRNPWRTDELSLLMSLDGGRIVAFVGVIPRPMLFRGRQIQAAALTELMADSDGYRSFAGVELLKRV